MSPENEVNIDKPDQDQRNSKEVVLPREEGNLYEWAGPENKQPSVGYGDKVKYLKNLR